MKLVQHLVFVGSLLASAVASAQEKPASAPTSQPASQPANSPFPFGTVNTPENSMFKYGTVTTPNNNNNPALSTPETTVDKDRSSLAPGLLLGGAGVFGIAGIVTMGLAISYKVQAKEAASLSAGEPASSAQATEVKQLLASTRTTALLSDISFGLAIGFGGGGYLLSRRSAENTAQK